MSSPADFSKVPVAAEVPVPTPAPVPDQTPVPDQVPAADSALRTPTGSRAARRAAHAVSQIPEQLPKLVTDVVALLAALVARLRTPLLLLALAPVVPAAALVIVSALRGGPDVPFAVVLAVLGVIPAAWLGIRRRQLLTALQPPAAAAEEIYQALAPAEVWAQIKSNLLQLPSRGGIGLPGLGRRLWRGVKLTADLRGRLDMPRLAPFLPGRLRGAGFLAVGCLASAIVLGTLTIIKLALSLIGIG